MSSFHEWHPDFKLSPSIFGLAISMISHCLALFALVLAEVPDFVNVTLALLVLLSMTFSVLKQHGVTRFGITRRVTHLRQTEGQPWDVGLSNGTVISCLVSGSSVVSRYLISLRFKPVGRPWARSISVLITADSLSKEDYRQLQVWLRWQSPEQLGG